MLHNDLDRVLRALADPIRRAMVERLTTGAASVSELARPFPVTLSAIGQHLQLLEAAGLVRSTKAGRVRTVELLPGALSSAEAWFASQRTRREQRCDAAIASELQKRE